MSNGARNLIFTNQDYYRLFPNGIPKKKYQPRQLYPHEIRTLKVILRNPLLEKALRNEFGKRPLNDTEINTLKVILCTHKESDPVIEKIIEESIDSIVKKTKGEIVEIEPVIEIVRKQNTNQISLTFQEQQQLRIDATYAHRYREVNHEDTLDELRYQDDDEARSEYNYRSFYEDYCIEDNWHGYININRFWFSSSITTIDKTQSLNPTSNDSPHYHFDKSNYQAIVTNLSPDATEREYGRVFFNTETRYNPWYIPAYRYQPQEIRGYSIRKNRKIYYPRYVKPYKGVFYHINENGSILKKRTERHHSNNSFVKYIDSLKNHIEHVPARHISRSLFRRPYRNQVDLPVDHLPPPQGPPKEGYIFTKIYRNLLNSNLPYPPHDYTDWVKTFDYPLIPDHLRSVYLFIDPTYKFWITQYYNRSQELNDHIDYVLQTNLRCRHSIKKIERKYCEYKQAQHKKHIDQLRNLEKPVTKTEPTPTGEPSGSGQV